MTKKSKISLPISTIAITFLIITAYHAESQTMSSPPHNRLVSEVVEVAKSYTPPTETKPVVAEEMPQISTQTEECTQPTPTETSPPQPTEKEESNNTPIPTTQTATKTNVTSTTNLPTPKMGNTRIVNGQKQSYFLGFGWVDDMGKNEVIYCEGMYENRNKIGIMGQSDGDINKMVGIMD